MKPNFILRLLKTYISGENVETPNLRISTGILMLIMFFALSSEPSALSQIPQGFNYQAVAHTTSGGPISSTTIQVKMGILSDTLIPVVVYEELHSSIKTNVNGVFNVVIGTGVKQSGSAASFSQINWNAAPLYLKVQINYQGTWKVMGNAKLWSVPYSMIAGDLAGAVKKLSVAGQTSTNDEALFEVKNKYGQTVFAVYNEGVRVYVSDGAKGLKGGFAVGGFGTDKAESTKYMFVGKDSIRIYLDTNPLTKKMKGGFAVGGYDLTKGVVQDYLDVNSDSVRIYIDSNPATKKLKGGFAVGGYDMTKGEDAKFLKVTPDSTRIVTSDTLKGFGVGNLLSGKAENYLKLTPSNYLIGHQAGKSITTGKYNSILGYQSGYYNTSGSSNSFFGFKAGYNNSLGNYNVFIGFQAGYTSNGNYNTATGYQALYSNTGAYRNTAIGYQALYSNTNGNDNTAIGTMALQNNSFSGHANTAIGCFALQMNTEGQDNVAVGGQALQKNTTGDINEAFGREALRENIGGSYNTATGHQALLFNVSGNYNVAMGYHALWNNTTGQGNIGIGYLANVSSGTLTNAIAIGYNAVVNASNKIVLGNASSTTVGGYGAWTNYSDVRLKENLVYRNDLGLDLIMRLKTVSFNYRNDINKRRRDGLIAQDVQQVLKDMNLEFSGLVIDNDEDQTLNLSYGEFVIPLINAVQELDQMNRDQKDQIESYKSENDNLKSQLQSLQEKVGRIEAMLTHSEKQ